MKYIIKKYWFFIAILIIPLFMAPYFFSPNITVINESDRDVHISFYQYLGSIDENRVIPADTRSVDRMAKGDNSFILKKGDFKIFRANLFDLNRGRNSNEFDVLEVYWKKGGGVSNKSVEYRFSKGNQKKTICSIVIYIGKIDYSIEEKNKGICLRRVVRVFD